jgi:hypothetical protein
MSVTLHVNLEDEYDLEEDYHPKEGWENNEFEMPPWMDVKFASNSDDLPDDINNKLGPPLGDKIDKEEMRELSERIKSSISKPQLEEENKRDRLVRLYKWIEYWEKQDYTLRVA